ncbi:MAG: hypothetical protein Tsb002_03970 [Wenzhouxiangellaceae bacterium]
MRMKTQLLMLMVLAALFSMHPAAAVPFSNQTVGKHTYRVVSVPGAPFRVICEQPCDIPDEVLLAEFEYFGQAHDTLFDFAGFDVLPQNQPVDFFVHAPGYCAPLGNFGGYSHHGSPLSPAGQGSTVCNYRWHHALNQPNQQPLDFFIERLDKQVINIHEYLHILYFDRFVFNDEDSIQGLSWFLNEATFPGFLPIRAEACGGYWGPFQPPVNLYYWFSDLCQNGGFDFSLFSDMLREMEWQRLYAPLYGSYAADAMTIRESREIMESFVNRPLSQMLMRTGYSGPAVGGRLLLPTSADIVATESRFIELALPDQAVSTDTPILLEEVRALNVTNHQGIQVPPNFRYAFELVPDDYLIGNPYQGVIFQQPVEMRIRIDPKDFTDLGNLVVYQKFDVSRRYIDPLLPVTILEIDESRQQVVVEVDRLGLFMVSEMP